MLGRVTRIIAAIRFQRQLERNLAARKQARREGRVFVSHYTRRA